MVFADITRAECNDMIEMPPCRRLSAAALCQVLTDATGDDSAGTMQIRQA
jgi:hypothetical protein